MQELFEKHPELYGVVQELIANTHAYLYDSAGGGDYNIESWNDTVPKILEAARGVPSLREWVAQLDSFREAEHAECLRTAAA